jgi:peptidoglycan/LPS O-acetylase OafA/YrhL
VYLVVNGDRFDVAAPVLLLVRLTVTAAVTALSWFVIEQPALRLKRRFAPPAAPLAASGAGPDRATPTR